MKHLRTLIVVLLPFAALLLAVWPQWRLHAEVPAPEEPRGLVAPYRFPIATNLAYEKEIDYYQQVVKRDPTDFQTLALLAADYMHEAKITNDPAQYLLAEKTAQESYSHFPMPADNAGAVMVLAQAAEARHDFRGALKMAREIRQARPGKLDAYPILVNANMGLGRIDEAARWAEDFVKRSPSLGSYTQLFLVREAQGRDGDAVDAMRRGLEREEGDDLLASSKSRTFFGRYFFRRGRLVVAGDMYVEAVRIMPQNPLALAQMAELQAKLGQYDAAEAHYGEAYRISPTALYLHGKARVKIRRGDREAARDLFHKAELQFRRDLQASPMGHGRDLALLLLERGDPQDVPEAVRLLEKDLGNRRDPPTLDAMAWAYDAAGREPEARQVEAENLRSGIREAIYFYRAARIEKELGHPDVAWSFVRQARQTDPALDAADLAEYGL